MLFQPSKNVHSKISFDCQILSFDYTLCMNTSTILASNEMMNGKKKYNFIPTLVEDN